MSSFEAEKLNIEREVIIEKNPKMDCRRRMDIETRNDATYAFAIFVKQTENSRFFTLLEQNNDRL